MTMIFDERGKLLTGGDVAAAVAMLEGLRVDALGINCGLGPAQMLPVLEEILRVTSLPVIVKPNAGPAGSPGRTDRVRCGSGAVCRLYEADRSDGRLRRRRLLRDDTCAHRKHDESLPGACREAACKEEGDRRLLLRAGGGPWG